MKYISEYRDAKAIHKLAAVIKNTFDNVPITIMEVCGTHTMSIARFGIKSFLPDGIKLISGPGCPVCVTPNRYIDHSIALTKMPNAVICTFGDMMRVPGSTSSLEKMKASGADVRVVYSTMNAIEIAMSNPDKEVIFLGVGFETTTPTIAASILHAQREEIKNYSVLCANKIVPPALLALLESDIKIDAFLLPGHVSSIIGSSAYGEIFKKKLLACAIAGFEPLDIMNAIYEITKQLSSKNPSIHNSYKRAVNAEGNIKAKKAMNDVFEICDAEWRGIGSIPQSGLKIREVLKKYDANIKFDVPIEETVEPNGCRCGEVLIGKIGPHDCPLFGKECTPSNAIGSCMVSSEGTCAAYYKYSLKP